MVERDGLENRCTRKGTVGSNPTLSARFLTSFGLWRFGCASGDGKTRLRRVLRLRESHWSATSRETPQAQLALRL